MRFTVVVGDGIRRIEMRFDETQNEENRLERELHRLDPDNPALKYYGSVWAAIDAYRDALDAVWANKPKPTPFDGEGDRKESWMCWIYYIFGGMWLGGGIYFGIIAASSLGWRYIMGIGLSLAIMFFLLFVGCQLISHANTMRRKG